jgi:tetratricopeptide (TPR) repeat protein
MIMIRMKLVYPLLLLYIVAGCLSCFAEQADHKRYVIDSLQKNLMDAKHDTDKIKLRYAIGKEMKIVRTGYWDSLLTNACTINMSSFQYLILYELVSIHKHNTGNHVKADECLKRAITLAETKNNKEELINALVKLIELKTFLSDTKSGIELCYKGLKISEEIHDKLAIANFYARLAQIYRIHEENKKSLAMQLKCLALFKELDKHYEIAGCLLDIGYIYLDLSNNKKATAYFFATKQYADEFNGTPAGCEINTSIGCAYQMKGQYDKAGYYFDKAYRASRLLGLRGCEASVLLGWATSIKNAGDTKVAEKMALRSLKISKQIGFKANLVVVFELLSEIYTKQKNYKKALENYKQHITMRDSVANEKTRGMGLEKEYAYSFEKKDNQNKLLARENQIQLLQLKHNKYQIAGLTGAVLSILVIAGLFVRQSKLRSIQRSMQLEQKLLRSQMNPHFIFNSLQAIQNFILKQEGKEAVKYLSTFAFITRSVLENSRNEYISLDKEITLLENYLQLQKLRFRNRFNYSIHVDERLNSGQVNIPPMIAQPFIENAVEHGMQDIENDGHISISYTVQGHFLHIEITDNGYGMQGENATGRQHQSMAMDITKERIALMNKKEKHKAVLTVGEAFPSTSDRKGVKVTISLPLDLSL